jgi:prevent-host-death family protein
MENTETMGIKEFRAELPKRVEAAYFHNQPTIVTKNGEPRAALVPYSWLAERNLGAARLDGEDGLTPP